MSDPHAPAHDDGPHEGPIRTPKQLMVAVVASFLVPIVVIIMLVNFVNWGAKPGAGSDGLEEAAVAKRLQRVGSVVVREPAGSRAPRTGEEVFKAQCSACHAAGLAGAPKLGDAAAWGPRVGAGYAALLNSALKGKGAMAPQGGGEFSDFEVGRAVVWMANQGGAKFAEPVAPAASGSSAAPAAPAASAP